MSFGNIHQEHMGKPVENEFWQDPSRTYGQTSGKWVLAGSIEHMGKPVENEFQQDPSRALIITINKALSGSIQTLMVSFMTKPLVTPSGT